MPVKLSFAVAVLSLSLAFACKRQPAPASVAPAAAPPVAVATPAAPPVPVATAGAPAEPTAANVIRGKVTEKIDVNQYSYLKIDSSDGEVWTAVLKTSKGVGDVVGVLGPIWMENFKSATLNRAWAKIAFGTLQGETPSAPAQAAPSTHGVGTFAGAAAQSPATALPPGHPAPAAPADIGAVKVAKAPGAQGRTIADIYAHRAQLKDHAIAVRGKVVKATNGVMGKNWLHLRDGTGQGATSDLTVASDQTAGVGATVLVTGTVHLDRDLGAGYYYDVIVEDAQAKEE